MSERLIQIRIFCQVESSKTHLHILSCGSFDPLLKKSKYPMTHYPKNEIPKDPLLKRAKGFDMMINSHLAYFVDLLHCSRLYL